MGNCFTRHQRDSEEDGYPPWTVFPYPFHPAAAYSMYYPRTSQPYYPSNAYYDPTSYFNNPHHNPPSHPYSSPYNHNHRYEPNSRSRQEPKTYNLHPYPTGGRPLGPLHLAAEKENITLGHVPGGCYKHGRCERLHMRWTIRELERRGVDERGLSLRQALRVVRGYEAGGRGDAYVGQRGYGQERLEQGVEGRRGLEWRGVGVEPLRGSGKQRMQGMGIGTGRGEGRGSCGKWGLGHYDTARRNKERGFANEAYMSGGNPRIPGRQSHTSRNAMGGAFANGTDYHPDNRGMSRGRNRGSRPPHGAVNSQYGTSRANGTDYESASREGCRGQGTGWENENSQYTGRGGGHGDAWENEDEGEYSDGVEYDDDDDVPSASRRSGTHYSVD